MEKEEDVRVVYKIKKKQTAACNFCKIKKLKCNGHSPCINCAKKGVMCEYSEQKKRGVKKKELNLAMIVQDTNTLKASQRLWNQTERVGSVDKFCGMRVWWRNMLDVQRIKVSTSMVYFGHVFLINAWLARIENDSNAADKFYQQGCLIAAQSLNDNQALAVTTLHLLLSEYDPSVFGHAEKVWQVAEKIVPNDNLTKRMRFYGLAYRIMCENEAYTIHERVEQLAKMGEGLADTWDIAFYLSVKVCLTARNTLSQIRNSSGNSPVTLSTLSFSKAEREAMLFDTHLCENLFLSQINSFGFEWTTRIQYWKIILLWASGNKERSVQEAIKHVEEITSHEHVVFLQEIKLLLLPVMMLNEAGITKYNKITVQVVEKICTTIGQTSQWHLLTPLLNDLLNSGTEPISYSKTCDIATFILDTPYPSLVPHHPATSITALFPGIPLDLPNTTLENDLSLYFNSVSFVPPLTDEWMN